MRFTFYKTASFVLISVVFGTRPEAIKLAPVIDLLRKQSWCTVRICVTGQHNQMLQSVLELFGLVPDVDLAIMRPHQSLYDVTIRSLRGLRREFQQFRPSLVVVQGDTTTTFVAALAAYYEQTQVAHVEAGLRTFNKYAPFPEEINRVLTTHIADWHYAPTHRARENLLREGVNSERILVTGNTAIDALQWVCLQLSRMSMQERRSTLQLPEAVLDLCELGARIVLVTGHRRESFGPGFERICTALVSVAQHHPDVTFIYPVHLNPNVQMPVRRILGGCSNIILLDPVPYREFAYLMMHSYCILTDSGGIQEEAPSLGKPVIVMREVTERPEAIEAGTARLVGTSVDAIVTTVEGLLTDNMAYTAMARSCNPYGDGRAAERIVTHISTLDR